MQSLQNKSSSSIVQENPKLYFFRTLSKNYIYFALTFLAINFALRIGLIIWTLPEVMLNSDSNIANFADIVRSLFVGVFFDTITLSYFFLLPLLYLVILPIGFFRSRFHLYFSRFCYFIAIFTLIFSTISELVFWHEFQTRFNFIAIDYLIYTTEVINNLIETYPVYPVLLSIFAVAIIISYLTRNKINFRINDNVTKYRQKFHYLKISLLAIFSVVVFDNLIVDNQKILPRVTNNNYLNEIASNGIYQLFSAYRNNEINYHQLYRTINPELALKLVRDQIAKQEPKSTFLSNNNIERLIPKKDKNLPEKNYNIVLVVMESFSADFLEYFGNKERITPNLDNLAKNSLFLANLKATGTRTVRGLEALTLSVPPTPGNSIVRRVNNKNLFNISSPMIKRGYEAKFIYGGDGYFDNMNNFFANNGFSIVDRGNFSKEEISFNNAWGVSDEDLFNKAISEAKKSDSAGKKFLQVILTTSNHRPFTYPDNKIDIPSKTNRNGAVKYSDYAIGKFLKKASQEKFFNNTIFVFVADHCAGSAGNTDVPLWRYQIPAIFYAPKIIKPRIVKANVSQIDIAPTIFSLLNWQYQSKFFGSDILSRVESGKSSVANSSFVGTYTNVGYFVGDKWLYLLQPKQQSKIFEVSLNHFGWQGSSEKLVQDSKNSLHQENLSRAVAYYQLAAQIFKEGKLGNEFSQ